MKFSELKNKFLGAIVEGTIPQNQPVELSSELAKYIAGGTIVCTGSGGTTKPDWTKCEWTKAL